jgi:DNA polymerase delta subunit 2
MPIRRLALTGASNRPQHVRRLLEVENGKLCYVVGTVYVDMPLKPNVLEDLARDVRLLDWPSRAV